MFAPVSGFSNAAHLRLNSRQLNVNAAADSASFPVQTGSSAAAAQPVPPVREVISNEAKFSIESLLDQHASDPAGMAVRMRISYPDEPEAQMPGIADAKSAQEVFEEAECQTCAERKYQDGSDDPGVSFKTATHLSPEEAATAVRGHEMEHVVRNRSEAARENHKVVSQSVTIHTAICPECGRVYTSGGTTRTVTAGKPDNAPQQADPNRTPFSAVA